MPRLLRFGLALLVALLPFFAAAHDHGEEDAEYNSAIPAEDAEYNSAIPAEDAESSSAIPPEDAEPDSAIPAEDAEEPATEGQDEAKKKDEKWDVANPPGERKSVEIDTTTGTWMSLDVSPDGGEIVFDLLGDLYALPIAGGEAKALTSGLPWDMQPRYSPDGKSIAFTSDRGGGDNLWLIDRDGANPRAVTKETFRLLNSPAWRPDGEVLAARKHFTATRSLGTGEIWLYHRSGGDGLRLTDKPNDQKDVGEPAFSPDGRYLYFSQDTTPGAVFQYDKDPNGTIYEILRLDLETGRRETLVSEAGGSIRPTPSPDGKSLAFVRRIRAKSVLVVRDLLSGADRVLDDGLDRDLQETWAVHGVYPAFAWTPDAKSIVVWADGRIHRVDVASATATKIPFHVRQTLETTPALRFPVEVAPDRFAVKMLRGVEVSPQGDRVVYQALGHLWIRDLPDGAPRRLTAQNDHFELDPAFSRDGQAIVYASWDDDALGAIRVVPASGGPGRVVTGRVVTDKPGHYHEPAFSPDGKSIVYRQGSGGFLTSPLWSQGPGLYVVPAAGGPSTRLTGDGQLPHFGAGSDRVYFIASLPEDRRALKSLALAPRGLDEREPRTHLESGAATEMRLSPDGRWVAFVERYKVFVAPFVDTGRAVEIGPKASAIPLAKVAKDAGTDVRWSGDSKSLHWALGPELFSRDLKDAFAFLAGAPEKLPEPLAIGQGVAIGFEVDTARPQGTIVIEGGRAVTMNGEEIVADSLIVVEGDRIASIGRRGEVAVPEGATVIDARGKTILPGIVDVHWHGSQGSDGIVPEQGWFDLSSLAFGVTTIHDPSTDTATFFTAAEMQKAGLILAPRLFSTGTILYGASGEYKAEVESLDDARFHLARLKAVGAISVKSYNQPRRDQRQQILAAARELGMMVVPEGGSLFTHDMTMVVDGHTGLEHSLPQANVYDDVVQLWSQTEVGYTPTLVVGYGGLMGENYWYAKTKVWENERLLAFTPRFVVDPAARRSTLVPDDEYNHLALARHVAKLQAAGVEIQVGAHGQREGLGAHWELWMLAQGGMPLHDVWRAATIDGARYLGLDKDVGSLEPGKLADLIVVAGDPLADVRDSEKIEKTMIGGRLYDATTLDEIAPNPRKRPPLFFAGQ